MVLVINNATFDADEESEDIHVQFDSKILVTVVAGTKTGSPTMDVKIQVKDSNDNYIDHTSFTQITAAGSALKELSNFAGKTIRVLADHGGSGSFANTTIEVQHKK